MRPGGAPPSEAAPRGPANPAPLAYGSDNLTRVFHYRYGPLFTPFEADQKTGQKHRNPALCVLFQRAPSGRVPDRRESADAGP